MSKSQEIYIYLFIFIYKIHHRQNYAYSAVDGWVYAYHVRETCIAESSCHSVYGFVDHDSPDRIVSIEYNTANMRWVFWSLLLWIMAQQAILNQAWIWVP